MGRSVSDITPALAQEIVPVFEKKISEDKPTITILDDLPKQTDLKAVGPSLTLAAPTKPRASQQKQEKQVSTKKGKHWAILGELCDPTTKPFTISYLGALNAMSKIDILELPPKKGGDFRKLVRLDSDQKIIGQTAAYKPATSDIGRELMKIYREFIKAQLQERTDLK